MTSIEVDTGAGGVGRAEGEALSARPQAAPGLYCPANTVNGYLSAWHPTEIAASFRLSEPSGPRLPFSDRTSELHPRDVPVRSTGGRRRAHSSPPFPLAAALRREAVDGSGQVAGVDLAAVGAECDDRGNEADERRRVLAAREWHRHDFRAFAGTGEQGDVELAP